MIIAEVDKKLKGVKFYHNALHVASCNKHLKSGYFKYNLSAYFRGVIKNLNDKIYLKVDVEGLPLTPDNLRKLEAVALDMARAKMSLKK